MNRYLRLSLGLMVLASLMGWPKPAASIAPSAPQNFYTVSTFADGTAACSGINCPSLRSAILQSNALAGDDDIFLPAGIYTVTLAGSGENAGLTGDLDIAPLASTDKLTIQGSGALSTIIDGGALDRVLDVLSGTLVLKDLTVRNGGGAGRHGLNVRPGTSATLERSTVLQNAGEGLLIDGSIVTLNASAVLSNTDSGLHVKNGGVVYLNNVTIADNIADSGGGLNIEWSSASLNNVTVTSNTVSSTGGGIFRSGASITNSVVVRNSLIGTNSADSGNPDCAATLNTVVYSLIQNTQGCSLSVSVGNLLGQSPVLGQLQNNGGDTWTQAPGPGSPIINAGDPAGCRNHLDALFTADQRGTGRPQGSACDMGAYEVPAAQFLATTYTAAESVGNASITVNLDGPSALTVTVPYTASAGTATAGSDFTPVTGALTIPASAASASFPVTVISDTLDEPSETVSLSIGQPTGALLETPTTATLTIQDDDASPSVALASALYTATEPSGSALITATLSAASGWPITITYATSNGTALAGSDYTAVSNQLAFAPGLTRTTFTVPVINDNQYESNETLGLTLSNPQNAVLGAPNTATLTLVSEDPPRTYLPLMLNNYLACYTGANEIEPNGSAAQATGPLCFGQTYAGAVNSAGDNDYYTFVWQGTGSFSVDVTPIGSSPNWQAQFYYQVVDGDHLVGYLAGTDMAFHFACPGHNGAYPCAGATGQYYLRLVMPGGSGYTVRVSSP